MSSPETPPPQNEKLPWTAFEFCAISEVGAVDYQVQVTGVINLDHQGSEIVVRQRALGAAAKIARDADLPWNPFNVAILIIPDRLGTK